MRSDEEDDEDEYYDDNEEDEDEGMDVGQNGMNGDGDEEDGDGDGEGEEGMEDGYDDDGSDEENANEDEDGDGEGDDDEDEDEDDDGEEEDEDDNEEEDEDEQEGEGTEEDDQEGEDVDMTVNGDEEAASEHPSQSSKLRVATDLPAPPHLIRRSLLTPAFNTIPSSLAIEAIVGIPLPSAVHSLATSTCSSYLLAGSQDGYVRAYDLWGSVNGAQMMTAQQRSVVGLGETVSKAGVGRGWWANEVEGINGGQVGKRAEPVYSMACEGDALWALTGTQSGPINLYTLRHSPGHQVHSLKGHSSVVSCMTLLPNEKGVISGSWDGTLREWDLNTGQTVRTYPTHGAQLSSLSLRPFSHPPSPTPSPRNEDERDEQEEQAVEDDKEKISISMGPDFFEKRSRSPDADQSTETVIEEENKPTSDGERVKSSPRANGDVEMAEANTPVSGDSLFGDDDADADGETVPPSLHPTNPTTPVNDVPPSSPTKPRPLPIAIPGQARPQPVTTASTIAPEQPTPSSASAPLFVTPQAGPSTSRQGAADSIPLLSPTTYKSFSDDVLLTSSMDGQVVLIDRRIPSSEGTGVGVGRLMPGDRAPPWCMSACWLANGNQVLAGRRNGTIDIWDVRRGSSSTAPNLLRTLRTPIESGPVSCVVAFPDGRHIATASQDNIRLWNSAEYFEPDDSMKRSRSKPPFKIIAGHHGGTISSMIVDPTSRFMITASGDRGWQGESTKVVLIHEVKW
ncbi:hypothetical protein IAR55_003701 [Kwoniella newhampshirensis]|uniref:Transcription factor spt8 beta-propeller domain-containing protein n=1 Tax=Kwoniella newhampshirensis TaxID=1651941 RepID=A0AAW0YPC2_9TREE